MNGAMIKSEILRAVKHTLRMTAWRFAHPRRGGISVLPLPVILSEAIAEHPRRGGISVLPLLVILRSAATKDLGVEWGHDQKRDPSGGEAYPQDDTQKQSF